MILLKDLLSELQTFAYSTLKKSNGKEYLFSTKNWDYQVNIISNDSDPQYPYLGFRAKKAGDPEFNFDMDVITNDDIYSVMQTIKSIIKQDISNSPYKGYTISTIQNKKGNQRMNFYKKILTPQFKILPTDILNRVIITPNN